jgi:hypothetical protein
VILDRTEVGCSYEKSFRPTEKVSDQMPRITTGIVILLCLATAAGCWFIYGIEHQRDSRESREFQAKEQAALELEMYQAWHYATRYETFKNALRAHLEEEARTETVADSVRSHEAQKGNRRGRTSPTEFQDGAVWVKSFQRSDVKFAGKSSKYGNATYQVSSVIIWRTRDSEMLFLSAQSRLEKMDGPGDWVAAEWKFGLIEYSSDGAYHSDFPAELVKRSE